jgi:hypothetical protein
LLRLAESKDLHLVIPSFALSESHHKLIAKQRVRRDLTERLQAELGQLSRSGPYAAVRAEAAPALATMVRSLEGDRAAFEATLGRVLTVAAVIPTTARVFTTAIALRDSGRFADLPDAVVYASVATHAAESGFDSCFLNLNVHDFSDPDLQEELTRYRCKLLFSFESGLGYVRTRLTRA